MKKNYKRSTKNTVIKNKKPTKSASSSRKGSITTNQPQVIYFQKSLVHFSVTAAKFVNFSLPKPFTSYKPLTPWAFQGLAQTLTLRYCQWQVPLFLCTTSVFPYNSCYSKTDDSLSVQEPQNYL